MERIDSLTSLRFFAAILVVFSHLSFLSDSDSKILSEIYRDFFREGFIGVAFFFILSGFILSFSYSNRISGKQSYIEFLISRFSRIYPLHIFTLILAAPVVIYTLINDGGSAALLANLILIQSFFSDPVIFFSGNAPSWSLSNEMFFYVLFPLLLFRSTLFLVLLAAVTLFFQLFIANLKMTDSAQHYYVYIFPFSRLFDFVLGLLLYRVFASFGNRRIHSFGFYHLFVIAILFVFFFLKDSIDRVYRYDIYYVLPFSLLILLFALDRSRFSKIFENKSLVLLGEASFSLYLVHHLVIIYLKTIGYKILAIEGGVFDLILCILILVLSIGLSIFLYRNIEVPARSYFRKALSTAISKR